MFILHRTIPQKNPLAAISVLSFSSSKNFFYTVQVYTVYQKVIYNSCLFLFFRSWNSENKRTYSVQVRLHCVSLKKINSVYQNRTAFTGPLKVWRHSLYTSFGTPCVKTGNIFLQCYTWNMLNIEYWIILYIFKISLCVTGPSYIF